MSFPFYSITLVGKGCHRGSVVSYSQNLSNHKTQVIEDGPVWVLTHSAVVVNVRIGRVTIIGVSKVPDLCRE